MTLLVMMIMPLESSQMKLTITSILMFFKVLFMLVMWTLLFSIKFLLLALFMRTMTYFLDRPLVVMLICGLSLLLPLIIYWMLSIFFTLRIGKASLILRIFLVLLPILKAYAYDLSWLILVWVDIFVLKNFEILLISLGVLVRIGGSSLSILVSLSVSLPLGLLFLTRLVFGV